MEEKTKETQNVVMWCDNNMLMQKNYETPMHN
jgi:hypothetical protein